MIARNIGVKAGKAVGWTAATMWKGVVLAADAAGEAGEGFMTGAEQGWEQRNAELDAKIAAHRAKLAAIKAELLAAKAESAQTAAVV